MAPSIDLTGAAAPAAESAVNGAGALDGVRVVDLTTVLMGPLASRMLADHGADVIRIEPPGVSTDISGGASGIGAIGLDIHRNKRSVILDLKSDEGSAAARELIATADVMVTNMRSAALARLGLDADSLRATQPELIHCLANGYGSDGPYGDRAAYDDAIQASSGLAALFARVDGEPAYVPSVVVDKTCSLYIVQAVMAALLHRHRTGQGQTIRLSMFETMASFVLVEHLRGAALVPPRGEIGYARLLNRNRKPYRCADGYAAILPYTDANWRDFFAIIDRPDLTQDPRFATHQDRVRHAVELYQFIVDAAPSRTVDEWMTVCAHHSIPASPVIDIAGLAEDPHLEAVELIPELEHPIAGRYRSVRQPIEFDTLDTSVRRHAPVPGEHTVEVLTEIGWSDVRIAELREPPVRPSSRPG